MDYNCIENANAGLTRRKRKKSIETRTHFTRSVKRNATANYASSSTRTTSSPLNTSTPLNDITNTYENQPTLHHQPTQNTDPSSSVLEKNKPQTRFGQTNHSGINLLNKFSATIHDNPSNSNSNDDHTNTPTDDEQPDDDNTDTDLEVEIYLDENSSSESETEMEEDHRAFRNNMSHTYTGSSSLQGTNYIT
jgi:hypothetical protein